MIRKVKAQRYGEQAGRIEESIAIEEPLLLRVNEQDVAILMRTPGRDQELSAGFLFTEGIVDEPGEIVSILPSGHPTSAESLVTLRGPLLPGATRNFYRSSSCGVCGRTAIDALTQRLPEIPPLRVDPASLAPLVQQLEEHQSAFAATGGLHAAGIFSAQGTLLGLAEDVGRHNALDKVIGRCFLDAVLPLQNHILVMSSRASFDILQKAALAGIPVVATIGAPSSLAIEVAARAGIALFGFLRPHRVTQYAGLA
ncbi:formate dehydrogenase accessory sulfurtransferase FdhD [Bryobacter aggregatus]|uniref:formate dehydrogenase accessory sulfurtransferase FdhD n=1 Tax=Bryobacter aggregatus TaxID=360054 RepID=UPI0004E1FC76|nr:formate dehydrogenase accessory sulfurtransferase FdhD [Bryobacter aggregatus]